MRPVKCQSGGKVEVCEPIAVSQTERVVGQKPPHPQESAAGPRFLSGVDERDAPGLGCGLMICDLVGGSIDRHIRMMQKEIHEIFFDHVSLVTEAHDEIAKTVVRVNFHNMPKYRPPSDLDH